MIGILHDITDRKRAEEILSHRAMHDADGAMYAAKRSENPTAAVYATDLAA